MTMTLLWILLALACVWDVPPFAQVVVHVVTDRGVDAPLGVAQVTRREVVSLHGGTVQPRVAYGTMDAATPLTLELPEGSAALELEGFDSTGLCEANPLGTEDSAFPCSFDGWRGNTLLWLSDAPMPGNFEGVHVQAGDVATVRVTVRETCMCLD